jgi:hypothetical protein
LDRAGGQTEWGIGLSDNNLLGTGKTFEIGYESEIDRDRALLGYSDGNVFGTRVQLSAMLANASDGHRRQLGVERPFFSLDTRWSTGGSVLGEQRVDPMYDLGEQIDEFGHEIEALSVQGGWSRGIVDGRTQRWRFGMASEEHLFRPSPDLNCLAAIKGVINNLDEIEQIVKLTVFVNGTDDFTDQPKAANGASELLEKIFGEKGKHSRSAVGVNGLPLGAAVEIEMIVRIA